jgi:hypothetical protein
MDLKNSRNSLAKAHWILNSFCLQLKQEAIQMGFVIKSRWDLSNGTHIE